MAASVTSKRVIPIASADRRGVSLGSGTLLSALPPLSLYVHFPWCVKKCPYCDFNSHEARGAIPEADYVQALIADLEHASISAHSKADLQAVNRTAPVHSSARELRLDGGVCGKHSS